MTLINLDCIKRVIFLDKKVYSEIAEDKDALVYAIIVVLLTKVISGIEAIISIWGFYCILILLILVLPIWCILVGIMHITAKLLGGKADFVSYLKVIGFAEAPRALGVIPSIGWIIGFIWCLACYFTATKVIHGLSTGKAIVAVIAPIILAVSIIWMSIGVYPGLETTGRAQKEAIMGLILLLLFFLW